MSPRIFLRRLWLTYFQICPWVIEGKPGQRINITIYDYSKASLCSSAHEYIQITDGNKESRTFDMCRAGTSAKQTYITETHRIEIIFSSHYDASENSEGSVFLMQYASTWNLSTIKRSLWCVKQSVPWNMHRYLASIHCSETSVCGMPKKGRKIPKTKVSITAASVEHLHSRL